MSPTAIGLVVFACTFGGALAGIWLRGRLPEHHLSADSRDTVKLGIGLIATLTALVLGLVTASAKSSFDALSATIKDSAAQVLSLDHALAQYGPETAPARETLKQAVLRRIELVWPSDKRQSSRLDPRNAVRGAELLPAQIRGLTPQTEEQRRLQSRATDLADSLLETRWHVTASLGTSVPVPFLATLGFWLTLTFASFGLLAPRNATVVAVLFLCALSVAGAVFLILEMDSPFQGLITVSPDPLRYALEHLNL